MTDIHLSRKELYDQVWTTSIVKLAKQYGLSDVGLAKICKKHNIPRPPLGYWARKYAGYNVQPTPLPKGEDVTIVISPNSYSQNKLKAKKASPETQTCYMHNDEPITVLDRLSDPHPLIRQSSEILNASQANELGIITPAKKDCLDIMVSRDNLRRALRIMNTVIKVLEKRGNSVYISEGHTKVKILEEVILFGIKEGLITKKKSPKEHNLHGRYEFGHSLVKVLLDGGADINEPRYSPLEHALNKRRLDLVELLFEHGVDIHSVPMTSVFETWQPEIMKWFIDHGADVEKDNPMAYALCSRIGSSLGVLKSYRDRFPSFQEQANIALRYHCKEGNLKWVSLLLWAGADPYAKGPEGFDEPPDLEYEQSALELAAFYGHFEVFNIKTICLDPNSPELKELLLGACY
jgi:hypothetical protein